MNGMNPNKRTAAGRVAEKRWPDNCISESSRIETAIDKATMTDKDGDDGDGDINIDDQTTNDKTRR